MRHLRTGLVVHWEGLDLGRTVRSAHKTSKNKTGGALGGTGPEKDGQDSGVHIRHLRTGLVVHRVKV